MTFKHKLSRRLAQLRATVLLTIVATACKDGGPLGSDYGAVPEQSTEIVGLLASSDNPTVAPDQPATLRAMAIRADGRRLLADVAWDAPDGGELRDTVIGKVATKYFVATQPGEYRLVSTDRGKRFKDTTRVTVPPGQLSASVVKLYLVPAVASLTMGAGQQFFVYGQSSTGDSVPVVASFQSVGGGEATGLYYTAGDTAGTFQIIAKMQGGPLADTAMVTIEGKSQPVTEPLAAPQPDADTTSVAEPISTTEPAPYTPPSTSGSIAELPRVFLDTRYQAPTGRSIVVPAGGDLQAALNASARGDVIELAAGATYSGNFVLPAKTGTGFITIRTATALPAEGTRVTPTTAASFAKIVTPNMMSALGTAEDGNASFYRIMGVQIAATGSSVGALMRVNNSSARSEAEIPQWIILDRVWIHGSASQDVQRCVMLNGRSSAVIDSYLSDCHGKGMDSQAIVAWNGPGPFRIVNNRLEGAGENVMFGGADPSVTDLVPSDIEFRQNHVIKPLSWKGAGWSIKNLYESKNSQRVLMEGNIFENNWAESQTGFAFVLKSANQSGSCNWCVTQDYTIRHNVIRNTPGGFNLAARQNESGGTSIAANDLDIFNNVFIDIGLTSMSGNRRMFQMLGPLGRVRITHNTGLSEDNTVMFDGSPNSAVVIAYNVFNRGMYGIFGSGHGEGSSALSYYAPGATFVGNVVVQAPSSQYPSSNHYPSGILSAGLELDGDMYRVGASSPYAGTADGGSSPGADLAKVRACLAGC